jgi:putative copper export protein
MAHPYYEEEQRFTNVRWLWLVLALIILMPLLLTFNDKGINQQEMIMVLLSTLLASRSGIGHTALFEITAPD